MLKAIQVRVSQGTQYIPDPRRADPRGFRGAPLIAAGECATDCHACVDACATQAIELDPLRIDLGRCMLCGDCAAVCPSQRITFDSRYRIAATDRAQLVLSASHPEPDPITVSAALRARFGRSLKLRSVSAGGCNGCELEVNALANVNFDIGRYGIDFVASPRHADGLVVSGPLTRNMAQAVELCWAGMPEPKFVVAVGACAISGSPFDGADTLDRSFLDRIAPTLYVPGCPAHPLTMVCGLLDLLGIRT
ncbi:MAG: 4Fe-4S dicluster domain-containing protein [Xanthomonadales bacterium]|nr:4Fe-4S dicluster domain-containing protein [Xanthomonadales bacterium]